MDCPVDDELLQMTERSGVEVDYCPRCRGVWLDRGELDKILARADRELDDGHEPGRYRERDEWMRTPGRPRKKGKSFLSEMFEFGDD